MKMGKRILCAAAAAVTALSLAGCEAGYALMNFLDPPDPDDPGDRYRLYKVVPNKWYEETINYYAEGAANNWANERSDLAFGRVVKEKDCGYLLHDLDGDGDDELLIGYQEGDATRFVSLYIWSTDFGAICMCDSSNADPEDEAECMYLCEDNIIRDDSYKKYEGKERYMKHNGENNSMTILEDVTATPQKWELTPFGKAES